ncbi:hypothetical protein [Virgibacillus halodenitrificans]|uniref:hypothetical protein n=1 Tax=Virgibacillus halodenitrificans TaxID=1482 RepID=UPI000EF509F8|nr:hypothetical protein [Virgibacillus halodenitrificans]
MIYSLINNHLNELIEAKEKNIGAECFERISPRLRNKISFIQNPMDLSSQAWNVILKSQKLLDFVNQNNEINVNVINRLVAANRNIEEIEKAIESPNLNEIDDVVDKTISEHRQSYYYGSYRRENNLDVLLDVVLYSIDNGFTPDEIVIVVKSIVDLYSNRKGEQYEELGKYRIDYLSFIQFPYAQELYDSVGHFKDQQGNFKFFQSIYDATDKEDFKKLYKPLKKALKESKQEEQLKEMFQSILMKPNAIDWLLQLCPSSKDIFLEREVRTLANTDSKEKNAYAIIYGEDSSQYRIFTSIEGSELAFLRTFIKNCIMKKKKAFIRLVSENLDTYRFIGDSNILFNERFLNILNLNTLNIDNLKSVAKMYDEEMLCKIREDVPLTFKEFEYLYQQKTKIDMEVFYELMDLSVDKRLRACRELPSLKSLLDTFDHDRLVQKVVNFVRVKPIKKWLKDNNIHIKDATDIQRLFVILAPEKFEKFLGEIQTGTDIEFIIKNEPILKYTDTLDQAKAIYITEDEDSQFMIKDIGLSKTFIKDNQSSIVSFLERGLTHVYRTLHENRNLTKDQLKNLRLITKAELANKLEEIKFVDEDFDLEIGLKISDKSKSEWKDNRSFKNNGFTIQETYDYETTIRIGENPVRSCLSWDGGSYSRCLLSHFDTNKKILVARDPKDRVSARASLRLTKGSENYIELLQKKSKYKKLGFKDIDGEEQAIEETQTEVKEDLVLFLERCYTSLDGSQAQMVRKQFIKLAQKKANELGAKLVIADNYNYDIPYDSNLVRKNYFVFISYSKNGYQYLDSLTGQASESTEGRYRRADVYVQEDVE